MRKVFPCEAGLIRQRPRDAGALRGGGIACKRARTHKQVLGPAATHPQHQRPPVALGCEMTGAGAAVGPAAPLPWGSTWYTAVTCITWVGLGKGFRVT